MAEPAAVEPVKYFVAILWHDAAALEAACKHLADRFGPIDVVGGDHLFDVTDYYVDEMSPRLLRRLIAFEPMRPPDDLVDAKLWCNQLEARLADGPRRSVNLDIGYLDHSKVVLASAKSAGQKIHLGKGIYADLMGRYANGRYQPFEWTFPDFKDGRYDQELAQMRSRYRAQRKAAAAMIPASPSHNHP